MSAKTFKHIAVTPDNYDRLKKFGEFGESFNDVVSRLMDKQES